MRNRLITIAICLSASIVSVVPASAQGNNHIGEFSVNLWMPTPEITIRSGSITAASAGTLTDIDFVTEFGIEDKSFPEFRFAVGRSHKFRFGYVPIKYEADATIVRRIVFRGQTFNVGVPASTNIK